MKRLAVISGTMGVGKTALCERLYKKLENSVWLDGDWCWMMNPWSFNERNKIMAIENISFLLRNFLLNSSFENVVFNWVLHNDEIWQKIYYNLNNISFKLTKISLVCSPEGLAQRMRKAGRDSEIIKESLKRLPLYDGLNSLKLDTTGLTIDESVDKLYAMIKEN
jgi:deoxyadenosine/deoxycytidine kinase